jgi:hypothetical protein
LQPLHHVEQLLHLRLELHNLFGNGVSTRRSEQHDGGEKGGGEETGTA